MAPAPQQQRAGLLSGPGARNFMGGAGGGILGGVVGGPIGALLGGLLGREIAARTYFPQAPAPLMDNQSTGLNDYGRQVQSESNQFSNAVSSGKGGLW